MSLLSLGAAAMIANAEAGEPAKYDLLGGQTVKVQVSAYLDTSSDARDLDGKSEGVKSAALVLMESDPVLNASLLELILKKNGFVSQDPRRNIRLQVGCLLDGTIATDAGPIMDPSASVALLASTSSSPVTLNLLFLSNDAGNPSIGESCASLVDDVKVALTDIVTSR